MATFVLVHGGAHGGWCFGRVARRLRQAGHDVYAPSLTGLADRKHLLSREVDLKTHVTDIANLLSYEELTNVILVGHSYGGMVITGVADRAHNRVGHLVYLDAAHPKNGESMTDNTLPQLVEQLRSEIRIENGVELVLFPDSPLLSVMGVTDPEDLAWMVSKITPHPWKSLTQKLVLRHGEEFKRVPWTSINCTAIFALLSEEERNRRTVGATRVLEIDTGHDLMITEPDKVAGLLLEVAATTE